MSRQEFWTMLALPYELIADERAFVVRDVHAVRADVDPAGPVHERSAVDR